MSIIGFNFTAGMLSLDLQSGLLLTVPIPEEHAAAGQQIEEAIQTSVTEARYHIELRIHNNITH